MGCIPCSPRKSELKKKMSSRQFSITPANFVRMSQSFNYSDYVEVKKLGSGAFAEVMLCLHKPTKTQRAVKLIQKRALDHSQKDTEFLLKEVAILRSLDHPNILRCFEIFENDFLYYVATEYCPAGDLFSEIVKMKKFTERQAAVIIYQLLSVLIYCHDKRVIHRDLKPENILLMEKGKELSIKVADFGNSTIFDPSSKLSGCFGSAYYIAPEVFTDSYNEKCDIWSTGIIMYILLTGRPPYVGRDNKAILNQVKNSPFKVTSENCKGLSTEAISLLKELLKVNVNSRASAREAVKHPWIVNNLEKKTADIEVALVNLKNFNCESMLKSAVHVYIASQISSYEDLKYFKNCFQQIDQDGNGKITREELILEYSKRMSVEEATKVSEEIIEKLDQDDDGEIDYTEFLVSCLERQKQVSLTELEAAFNVFDRDGNGSITVDEIKLILDTGEVEDEATWNEILREADTNGDGAIDLKEFFALMSTTLQTTLTSKLMRNISKT